MHGLRLFLARLLFGSSPLLAGARALDGSEVVIEAATPESLAPVNVEEQARRAREGDEAAIRAWEAEEASLDVIRRRGLDLYQRHQATILALEAVAELELGDELPSGWITSRRGNEVRVRFVSNCEEIGPCSLIDVDVDARGLSARSLFPPEPLTEAEQASWRGRQLLFETQTSQCDEPYNAVLMPDGPEGRWIGYLIAQPADAERMAVGGHMSVLLNADASRVIEGRDLMNRCVVVQRPPATQPIAITRPAAQLPSALHVFTSLLNERVLFVATSGGTWRVNGDVVERVGAPPP